MSRNTHCFLSEQFGKSRCRRASLQKTKQRVQSQRVMSTGASFLVKGLSQANISVKGYPVEILDLVGHCSLLQLLSSATVLWKQHSQLLRAPSDCIQIQLTWWALKFEFCMIFLFQEILPFFLFFFPFLTITHTLQTNSYLFFLCFPPTVENCKLHC